jgi:hypothetical protein
MNAPKKTIETFNENFKISLCLINIYRRDILSWEIYISCLLNADVSRRGPRGEGFGGLKSPSPKFRSFDKAQPNSQFCGKCIRNNLIKIRVSPICKLSGTPDSGATALQICIFSALCPQLNLLNPPPENKSWVHRVSAYLEIYQVFI